jgi:hypothetical protein
MGAYEAKLIGESDGHIETRNFEDEARAMSWLKGRGLAEHFSDQTARAELYENGQLKWTQSRLQTPEAANRDKKPESLRFLAKRNLRPKR